MAICENCGVGFREARTPEERLLNAVFGVTLCHNCQSKFEIIECTECGKEVVRPVYFDGKPYHSFCLPWRED